MTFEDLIYIISCSKSRGQKWFNILEQTFNYYQINSPLRKAAFLAQTAHESCRYTVLEENLNYSAEKLIEIFPKYFDQDSAKEYARHPIKIGARVYALRMGNGDEWSRDGWRYRGRGLIQLTGKATYFSCSQAIGFDFVKDPDKLATERFAALSAGWYWHTRGLNELSDKRDFDSITRRINGGLNGYEDRMSLYNRALARLGV